jgi:hypothetical protein
MGLQKFLRCVIHNMDEAKEAKTSIKLSATFETEGKVFTKGIKLNAKDIDKYSLYKHKIFHGN